MCDQTKWLIRKKLAPCLRIRVPPTPTVVCRRQDNNDAAHFQQDEQQPQDMTFGTTDKLLMVLTKIFGLLQTKFGSKAEDGDKPDEDDEKNDWQLAAAVIDRILFIIFSIILIGGSVAFSVVFALAYN